MTLAIFVRDAVDAMSGFDDAGKVTQDQILEIAGDLDSWNQEQDGKVELQISTHENKAKLSQIIQYRTGLGYPQASKFFDKMEDLFLDRSIPVRLEDLPINDSPSAGSQMEKGLLIGVAATMGTLQTAKSSEGLLVEASDHDTMSRLINLAKLGKDRDLKKLNFLSSGQRSALLADLSKLKEQMGSMTSLIDRMDPQRRGQVLSGASLKPELLVLSQSRQHLRNMLAHYWDGGKVRESDLIILRRYAGALQTLRGNVEAVNLRSPAVLSQARAVSSAAATLRQIAQPLQSFPQRLGFARGTAVAAAAIAVGGLLYFGLNATASALSHEEKSLPTIITPPAEKVDLKPTKAPVGSPENPINVQDLPVATISVEDLPRARARK